MTNDIISKLNASCREDGPQIWCKCMYCQAGREIKKLLSEVDYWRTAYRKETGNDLPGYWDSVKHV